MTWADPDYGFKKKITIDKDKVAGDETDFPILVSVTDPNLRIVHSGGRINSDNGYDIVFYNNDEDTLLKHEIETYDGQDGTLVFWVKIPSLSSSVDTDFYIYYGKADVEVDPSSTDTWDDDFAMVQHMNKDETSGDYLDSTSNGNDGSDHVSAVGVEGKVDGGQEFDGVDDYIECADALSLNITSTITLAAWVKTADAQGMVISKMGPSDPWNGYIMGIGSTANDGKICYWPGNYDEVPSYVWFSGDNTVNDDSWHYIVAVHSGTSVTFYKDGVADGTRTCGTRANNVSTPLWMGRESDSARELAGNIDEVRLSKIARSGNWIKTSFESMHDPDNFMSWGSEETPGIEHFHDADDTIAISDSLVTAAGYKRTPGDSLSLSDTRKSSFKPKLADNLDVSDDIATVAAYKRVAGDSLSVGDGLEKEARIPIEELLSMADALKKTFKTSFADTLSISDVISLGVIEVELADTLTISDLLELKWKISLGEELSITDQTLLAKVIYLIDTLSISDSLTHKFIVPGGLSDLTQTPALIVTRNYAKAIDVPDDIKLRVWARARSGKEQVIFIDPT